MNFQKRIAMWSGPRNLSTAMMRAFENRNDTTVLDEPFYAHYLQKTGMDHPGKNQILQSQSTNWMKIADVCRGPIPENKPIWYQKHMAQHNLDDCDISWIKDLHNCLLIRDPKYVITSYNKEFPIKDERLLGYIQQKEIVQFLERENGKTPPIIDATDILKDPENMLKKLCDLIGIDFSKRMLHWPRGKRNSDGIWAPFWYRRVEESTTFLPYKKKDIRIPDDLIPIYDKCMVFYSEMYEKRLKP